MDPYLRFIGKFQSGNSYPEYLCAHDHRLFYVEQGRLCLRFREQEFWLCAPAVAVFAPGIPYRLLFKEGECATYYILNFDFDNRFLGTVARPPREESVFCKEDIFSTVHPPLFDLPLITGVGGELTELLDGMEREHRQNLPRRDEICAALLRALLVGLERRARLGRPTRTHRLTEQVKAYLRDNLERPLSNGEVAEHFGYHAYHLNALFVKYEGITLHRYLTDARLQKAKALLSGTDLSVQQIAEACGFSGPSYFTETFTRHVGFSPSQYRRLGR